MATVAAPIESIERRQDLLSGTIRANVIDRWIFVYMAASFIVIVLAGFIPSSLEKIAAVQAGDRPPFPLVMHMHAVLMGSFLLLLLTQTVLMATGRRDIHRRLGIAAFVIVPAIVVVGFILVPTMFDQNFLAATPASPEAQAKLQEGALRSHNIKLVQIRIGLLFPLFIGIGLWARKHDTGLHKRMMILGTAMPLPAGIDRIEWLPTTLPESFLASDLYTLLAVSPMFIWDVVRNRSVHRAYKIWIAVNLPVAITLYSLWDTEWWHSAMRQLLGA